VGRKRVLAIVTGIIVARHLDTADDLFGGLREVHGLTRWSRLQFQWAERIMKKIDNLNT
jgi:hypothetical protein